MIFGKNCLFLYLFAGFYNFSQKLITASTNAVCRFVSAIKTSTEKLSDSKLMLFWLNYDVWKTQII